MTTIFQSTFARTLKKTLNIISMDKTDESESSLVMKKWCQEGTMEDAYEDDLEVAGPSLATEKPEGQAIQTGTAREGFLQRYIAKTFGQKLIITEETIEDCKYKEVIDAAKMLKRSLFKTVEYDATNILSRGFSSSYVGGDGVSLWSSTHPLANGGSFSNTMATPMSPSTQALIVATTQIMNFPDHAGLVSFHTPKKVVYPNAQWGVWAQILKSVHTPRDGNFAEINVANSDLDIEPVRNPYWLNTTTNWTLLTDVDDGIMFKWRRKPRGKTWVDNNNEVMNYSQSARWSRGWTNPRATLGVNA